MKTFIRKFLLFLYLSLLANNMAAEEGPTVEQIQALESLKQGQEVSTEKDRDYREILTSTNKPKEGDEDYIECIDCIYGYELFNSTPTTFALSSNVPITPDYTLGPGDKLTVEYYGKKNISKKGYIGRNGILHLPLLGPITLAGLTFSEANDLISKKIQSELIGTESYVTLSELRSN